MSTARVTKQHLYSLFKSSPASVLDAYVEPLNDVMTRYQIDNHRRVAMFLAQTGHESGGYRSTRITENLNYRVSALTAMFGSRISAADAARYGRDDTKGQKADQEDIANIIYGGEWGRKNLGNTQPGDGWKFRGRGLIQLTGRSNYQSFADAMKMSLDAAIAFIETPKGACESAARFWKINDINRLADADDVVAATRKINGGTIGLAEREDLYREALRVLRS